MRFDPIVAMVRVLLFFGIFHHFWCVAIVTRFVLTFDPQNK